MKVVIHRHRAKDAMRVVSEHEHRGSKAVVYRDPENDEFVVKFYREGKYQAGADYFTDDKVDAQATAKHFIMHTGRAKDAVLNQDVGSLKKAIEAAGMAALRAKSSPEAKSDPATVANVRKIEDLLDRAYVLTTQL